LLLLLYYTKKEKKRVTGKKKALQQMSKDLELASSPYWTALGLLRRK